MAAAAIADDYDASFTKYFDERVARACDLHTLAGFLNAAEVRDLGSLDLDKGGGLVWRTLGVAAVTLRKACSRSFDARAHLCDLARQGGDVATHLALAGAIIGARHGLAALPEAWVNAVTEIGAVRVAAELLGQASAAARGAAGAAVAPDAD